MAWSDDLLSEEERAEVQDAREVLYLAQEAFMNAAPEDADREWQVLGAASAEYQDTWRRSIATNVRRRIARERAIARELSSELERVLAEGQK